MRARRRKAKEKALKERKYELRQWKRWRRERLDAVLAGPYAEPAQALLAFLKSMTGGPSTLIDFVASGPWADADADVRFLVLALVDAVIIRRREQMGLAPYSDSLPGQQPNAFLILRAQLGGEFSA